MANSSLINDYIAGAVGGACGLVVGHPFDTTKVQMQTKQTTTAYKGSWDAITKINKVGMAHGFFRGMGFPFVSYGVVNSVFFGTYGSVLKYQKRGELNRPSTYKEIYIAGCVGGFTQLFVACPVDVVKVVLQSQMTKSPAGGGGTPYFRGPVQCINWLLRKNGGGGLSSLYRGIGVMAVRDIPSYGVYTVTYEFLVTEMTRLRLTDQHGVIANLVAGGTAGVFCWGLIIPLDVVKSLMQADPTGTKYSSMWDCARQTYRTCGFRAFWTGLTLCCVRAFPVNAVTFLLYSKSLIFLNEHLRWDFRATKKGSKQEQ